MQSEKDELALVSLAVFPCLLAFGLCLYVLSFFDEKRSHAVFAVFLGQFVAGCKTPAAGIYAVISRGRCKKRNLKYVKPQEAAAAA